MRIRYLDIKRLSADDGPGLRTVLYAKGCPLACKWCPRPDAVHGKKQLLFDSDRCLSCARCIPVCPENALFMDGGKPVLERRRCDGCFACVAACPSAALTARGCEAEPEALCRLLLRDRAYWGPTGGVTLSGGEALLQTETVRLLQYLQAEGAHTCVVTSGMLFPQQFEAALPHTGLVLYNLYPMDDRKHRDYTGQGNALILRNLALVAEWAKDRGRLWVRTPIVPGVTDSTESIRAVGDKLASLESVERWELVPFAPPPDDVYHGLGLSSAFSGAPQTTDDALFTLLSAARATCACPDIRIR